MQTENINCHHHELETFKAAVYAFYHAQGRHHFPWRIQHDPYSVLVSEIMLQQTQTYRVEPKFALFMQEFPNVHVLAEASLRDVLSMWQGLGYNRRGKALWQNAQRIVHEFDGHVPSCTQTLQTFASIGPNTACSIVAFAYNKPVVFIETNIRAVYLHSFFKEQENIKDSQLMPYIEATLDHANPREWYYALMDYGVYLKKMAANPSRKSAHHAVQSTFQGSDRQIRGRIIKLMVAHGTLKKDALLALLGSERKRYETILDALVHEKMVTLCDDTLFI
jgi:A/G-specific adenine glycosylase